MNDCSCLWIILLLISCGGCGGTYNNCGNTSFNSGGCSCNCLIPLLITWLFYGNGCGSNFNNNNSGGCGCNNF